MRICIKHREKATVTLENKKTGEEFDLCPTCEQELVKILNDKPTIEVNNGRKRAFAGVKAVKS